MALTISQMLAVSFPAVVNERDKAANQWEESALMHEMERQGMIKRVSLGPTVEATLDYQRNPGTTTLASHLQPLDMSETEVLTAAVYTPAEVSVPITWSTFSEATNTSETEKIAFVSALIENGLSSHDDLIESLLFLTSTNGFLGLLTHAPTNGQGSDGGIDSAIETWWRSQTATYIDDTDIEAAFTTVENACIKGSGSKKGPTLMVSNSATWSIYAGTQMAMQRWDSTEIKAGVKSIMFGNCKYIFSPYGTTTVYFLGKPFKLVVSKEYFRDKSDNMPLPNANGTTCRIYSAAQTIVDNRSRIGCAHL
jgi:hypothetical protein